MNSRIFTIWYEELETVSRGSGKRVIYAAKASSTKDPPANYQIPGNSILGTFRFTSAQSCPYCFRISICVVAEHMRLESIQDLPSWNSIDQAPVSPSG